jgi:hypothetical protein
MKTLHATARGRFAHPTELCTVIINKQILLEKSLSKGFPI